MANPQLEDGGLSIATEIVEALARINLTAYQSRILWVLFRKTYGWHKKEDEISLSQFALATGMTSQNACRTLMELQKRNIILISRNGHTNKYQFQKNYEAWDAVIVSQPIVSEQAISDEIVSNEIVSSEVTDTIKPDNQILSHQSNTNNIHTNNTIQIIKADKKLSSPFGEKVKEIFARLDKERGYRPPKRKAEAASIIRMLKTYTPDQILGTYQKLKQDRFWVDKELFMMTIESQIGAMLGGKGFVKKAGQLPNTSELEQEMIKKGWRK